MSKTIDFPYLRDEIVNVANGESDKLTALGKVRALKHTWLWLTKQPQRMAEFSGWISAEGIDWPENLWVGTSVTTQNTCRRLESLIQVGNDRTIRFVSAEPLWEQVTLRQVLSTTRVHWVITGGESRQRSKSLRPSKRFDLEWARLMRERGLTPTGVQDSSLRTEGPFAYRGPVLHGPSG